MSNPQSTDELSPRLKAHLLDLLDQQIEAEERKRCRRHLLCGEYLAEVLGIRSAEAE